MKILDLVAVVLAVVVEGQKNCRVILNKNGCNLPACRQKCYNSYKGFGTCSSDGAFGKYACSCFYKCN